MKRILAITACVCLLALPCLAAAAQPAPKHLQQSQASHDRRWQQMTPEQRSHVQQRAHEFRNMDPAQRQRVREAYRYYHSLPAREREHLREQWQQNPHHKLQDGRDIGPPSARSSQRRGFNQRMYTPPSMGVTGRHRGEPSPLIPERGPRSKPRQH